MRRAAAAAQRVLPEVVVGGGALVAETPTSASGRGLQRW